MKQTGLANNHAKSKLIARLNINIRPLVPLSRHQKIRKYTFRARTTNKGASEPEERQSYLTTEDGDDVGFKTSSNPPAPNLDLESFITVAGTVDIVEPEEAEVDIFGELSTGNYHFAEDLQEEDEFLLQGGNLTTLGLSHPREVMELPTTEIARRLDNLLEHVGVAPSPYPKGEPQRAVYCSRTLNMRAIQAIGYDMDYTLVHYDVDAWEGRVSF
jgi:5' nucleotidase family